MVGRINCFATLQPPSPPKVRRNADSPSRQQCRIRRAATRVCQLNDAEEALNTESEAAQETNENVIPEDTEEISVDNRENESETIQEPEGNRAATVDCESVSFKQPDVVAIPPIVTVYATAMFDDSPNSCVTQDEINFRSG